MRPTVGRIVHYVSHGTPIREDGTQAFTSQCRGAMVSEVQPEFRGNRAVIDRERVGLVVLNPTGQFFHSLESGGCKYDDGSGSATWSCDNKNHAGGTWHWPVRMTEEDSDGD